jgi:hypothetical protein
MEQKIEVSFNQTSKEKKLQPGLFASILTRRQNTALQLKCIFIPALLPCTAGSDASARSKHPLNVQPRKCNLRGQVSLKQLLPRLQDHALGIGVYVTSGNHGQQRMENHFVGANHPSCFQQDVMGIPCIGG